MTEQRKRFADKYFETLNGTQSAIFAGYSETSARVQASQLLDEEEIQEYLQTKRESLSEKHGITVDRILLEYRKIAFSDIREFYSTDGAIHNVKQIDDESAGSISSIKSKEVFDVEGNKVGDIIEVKTHDKIRALDALGRHFGIFDIYKVGDIIEVKTHDKIRALDALGRHFGIFDKDNAQKRTEVVVRPKISFIKK